jgi:hypothetical protein
MVLFWIFIISMRLHIDDDDDDYTDELEKLLAFDEVPIRTINDL